MPERFQQTFQVGIRESVQTPELRMHEEWLNPGNLSPVGLRELGLQGLVDALSEHHDMRIELPTASSCPSALQRNTRIISYAEERGVKDRIRVHGFLTPTEIAINAQTKVSGYHGYGNILKEIHHRKITIQEWLSNADEMSRFAFENGMIHFRASLEQSSQLPISEIGEFIRGLGAIKSKPGRVLTGLCIADTNGVVQPQFYEGLFKVVGNDLAKTGLIVFIHLHDDSGFALINAQTIIHLAQQYGIPVEIEATPDRFPGERIGEKPNLSELSQFGIEIRIPNNVIDDMYLGTSWKDPGSQIVYARQREMALITDVAGVHSNQKHQRGYGNGGSRVPATGLSGVMGTGPIEFAQKQLSSRLDNRVSNVDVLKAAALIGREFATQQAAQLEATSHADCLALAILAYEQPDYILRTARGFGNPLEWSRKPLPDLTEIKDKLNIIKLREFGIMAPTEAIYLYSE